MAAPSATAWPLTATDCSRDSSSSSSLLDESLDAVIVPQALRNNAIKNRRQEPEQRCGIVQRSACCRLH